ncbi:HNH endonuclease [Candidatus Spongiihabitans sp.]|uniref:HNH endonuclease n=1 Tax=Candidatus Spongiihabitans sp. TaxID=3101308 RepID=UPI003C6F4405
MKLDINFQRLERAMESINASKAKVDNIRITGRSPIEITILEQGSLILSGEELDEVLRFPAGIAAIGNTQITLHIFQPFVSLDDLQQIPTSAPRYHVADCLTLNEMRQRGRFDRYVSTAEADGDFRVEPWDRETQTRGDEMISKLAPCQNCLKFLNYDGFEEKTLSERKLIQNDFDIQLFFKNYEPVFQCRPLYNPDNFPEGNYTSDWARISEDLRIRANWKCKDCLVDLSDHHNLLHVHHIDGNRGNNESNNLEPLCCVCHKKKPFHERMHIKPQHRRLIEQLVSQ